MVAAVSCARKLEKTYLIFFSCVRQKNLKRSQRSTTFGEILNYIYSDWAAVSEVWNGACRYVCIYIYVYTSAYVFTYTDIGIDTDTYKYMTGCNDVKEMTTL